MPPSTDLASLTEAQQGCLATLPDPSKPGTGAVVECDRGAGHDYWEEYVTGSTGEEGAHAGAQADGRGTRIIWWDQAEGAVSHHDALALRTGRTLADWEPGALPATPRTFALERDVDVSGVSGTGRVAWGVLWPDGAVAVRWISDHATTAVHDLGMASVEAIHLHGGATRIVWL